jgi:glyoxylase-like metal-dependent hydrolase (beta-lactamase superfamily II)/rhodanese-related sulfurtransferase
VIEIVVLSTPSLGDRSYLATDGAVALAVDPQRDIDRVLVAAADRGVAVTAVFETHIHNDYVSGGLALARETGAAYYVNAADEVAFGRAAIADGDEVTAGTMRVRAVATPGHTFTHLSYVLEDATTGAVVAVFTGGSLLNGSTGRPDLLGAAHARHLAAAQHASARRLATALPEHTRVLPTHGFGSFCAAGPPAAAATTIGDQKRANPALTLDEDRYAEQLLAGLDVYPAYYARMGPANAAGADAPALLPPPPVTADQIAARIAAGEWVVDLRARRAFAAAHVPGSLSFELGDAFASNLGWLLPPGTPLTLLADTSCQVAAAQRELSRIGVDHLAGAATGVTVDLLGSGRAAACPVSGFPGLAAGRRRREVTILDVRRPLEWAAGHLDGARHIPLHELPGRLRELPVGPVWVHCQGGYRASVAASFLQAAGHTVTIVDDDFGRAAAAGLPVTTDAARVGALTAA